MIHGIGPCATSLPSEEFAPNAAELDAASVVERERA
jgi:hypothetical protein